MTGLFIPVYNCQKYIEAQAAAIARQTARPDIVLVVDSSTSALDLHPYKDLDADVVCLKTAKFDHGATRNLVLDVFKQCEFVIFITQDAVPASVHSFRKLLDSFQCQEAAAVYGRQVPGKENGPISTHARLYNYGQTSLVKTYECRERLGLKTPFISNSFAAYKMSVFRSLGGFYSPVIMGEDMEFGSRVLRAGYKICYNADATVVHCHDYSMKDEFCRYFDTGVFHHDQQWLLETFGKAEGEGRRFVLSELRYLLEHAPGRIPEALLRTVLKYLGYRLGRHYDRLPRQILPKLSMNRGYWKS